MNPETEAIFKFVTPHFVAIVWIGAPKDDLSKECTNCFSGSLISVKGRIFILTAGHVISLLDALAASGRELRLCSIYGNWNDPRVNAGKIDFNYHALERWQLDQFDDGLDYGLIALNEYVVRHMEACNMLPVAENQWLDPAENLVNHVLLGVPSENVRSKAPKGATASVDIGCTMLYVTPVSNPPPEVIKKHARFYGRVRSPGEVEAGTSVHNIDGMSGGPIYAAGLRHDGRPNYWLVGVQSGWHEPSRTIAACPVNEILKQLRRKFEDLDSQLKEPS